MLFDTFIIGDLIAFAGSLVGFLYGLFAFLMKKCGLYLKISAGALVCMMLARLLESVMHVSFFLVKYYFQIDILGFIGVFLFFLTANYGVMDSIADDKNRKNRIYRIIPLVAPLSFLGMYMVLLFSYIGIDLKISYGVLTAVIMLSSYYNLKFAIFPDVENGIISGLRIYNIMALLYGYLFVGELIAYTYYWPVVSIVLSILMALDAAFMLPVLSRGVKKWTI